MAFDNSDWVADSEDEYTLPANDSTDLRKMGSLPEISAIRTDPFTPDQPHTADESLFTPPPAGADSTIGDFTSVPATSGTPPPVVPKPRPRPRVVIKKPAPSSRDPVAASMSSHISDPSIPTRPTNDSIQPATATSIGFSEIVGDTYSSLDIAERAKMRSRNKSQTAKKSIQLPPVNEVIELTSDEDDFVLKPTKRQKKQANPKPKVPTKPRPKPRVKPKPVVPDSSPSHEVVAPHPQTPGPSSQLPASTLPTIPPSTPQEAREPSPCSSPPLNTRKRKRVRSSIAEDDDDEMNLIASNPARVTPPLPEPPPFFASSSSLPTDSGVEIPFVEPDVDRGKKKRPSNQKRKGKKGKEAQRVTEVEEPAAMNHEPFTPIARHSPSGSHSPMVKNSTATRKGKARVIDSDDEDELAAPYKENTACMPPVDDEEGQRSKENVRPEDLSPPKRNPPEGTPTTPFQQTRGLSVKPKATLMSELIRRVNSQPNSPFPNASRTYSPCLKSSRTMLSRIAPLHPNRRTPPPPPPRPPPPKKSKKQLEMEERIEEELAETVEGWSCLTDEERKALRKARIDAELGYE